MSATPSAPQGSVQYTRPILHKQRQWAWRCEAGYEMIAGQGLSRRDCYVISKAASVMQWRGSLKCLHMNASEPLIYYNPIVGEPCERGDGCSSISVHASQKSSNYEGSASGAGGHLDVCLPGRVPVKRPSSQPSTPLGFGPCGSCLQSQWLGSTSLVWWCNDEALITTNEYRRTATNL